MRIGIDVSPIIYETGVSWYTRNLVRALLETDLENKYVLFGGSLRRSGEFRKFFKYVNGQVQLRTFRLPPSLADFVWNRLHIFPIENLLGEIDVFHSSDWTQPPSKAYKVTTIHDLVPLRFPELTPSNVVQAHKRRLSWVKKEADKIISVSEYTKKEAVDLLGIDPGRIEVIYEGPDPDIKKVSLDQVLKLKKKYQIEGDYLLEIGTDFRKNLSNVVKAFIRFKKKNKYFKLVILGRKLEDFNNKDILQVGQVAREELSAFYSGAQAVVYASLYEGFGLPIIEAMKVGVPVVTSNVASMPEIAGEAGVLIEPKDPESIALGIEKAIKQSIVLTGKGKKRVEEFSWSKTAEETLRIYRGALQ